MHDHGIVCIFERMHSDIFCCSDAKQVVRGAGVTQPLNLYLKKQKPALGTIFVNAQKYCIHLYEMG